MSYVTTLKESRSRRTSHDHQGMQHASYIHALWLLCRVLTLLLRSSRETVKFQLSPLMCATGYQGEGQMT